MPGCRLWQSMAYLMTNSVHHSFGSLIWGQDSFGRGILWYLPKVLQWNQTGWTHQPIELTLQIWFDDRVVAIVIVFTLFDPSWMIWSKFVSVWMPWPNWRRINMSGTYLSICQWINFWSFVLKYMDHIYEIHLWFVPRSSVSSNHKARIQPEDPGTYAFWGILFATVPSWCCLLWARCGSETSMEQRGEEMSSVLLMVAISFGGTTTNQQRNMKKFMVSFKGSTWKQPSQYPTVKTVPNDPVMDQINGTQRILIVPK